MSIGEVIGSGKKNSDTSLCLRFGEPLYQGQIVILSIHSMMYAAVAVWAERDDVSRMVRPTVGKTCCVVRLQIWLRPAVSKRCRLCAPFTFPPGSL